MQSRETSYQTREISTSSSLDALHALVEWKMAALAAYLGELEQPAYTAAERGARGEDISCGDCPSIVETVHT